MKEKVEGNRVPTLCPVPSGISAGALGALPPFIIEERMLGVVEVPLK